jgi:hypothetical protein
MGRTAASVDLEVQVSDAEALWYDPTRWPVFVDGFKAVVKTEGTWPQEGARLVWDSVPEGRGRVVEVVTAYEVRRGQTVEVEDAKVTATQTVRFTPRTAGRSQLHVELRWQLKDRTPLTPVFDLLFVRRGFTDALRRTLDRFAREVRAEDELLTY